MKQQRILYISGSIGLGHVSKDLAIAAELRKARPEIEILWIAGHPASEILKSAGEELVPESTRWIGASQIAEKCTRNGQLNLVRYVYRSLPSWTINANLFRRIVRSAGPDLVVGNEAYEIDIPLVLGLLRVPVPFIMIMDFVGTDPTTGNLLDHIGAYVINAMWSFDKRIYGKNQHSAIFIGELKDIPDRSFGCALRNRRQHAEKYYDIVGHVVRFRPEEFADRTLWRQRMGYGDKPLIVCSAGGTSIGRNLLEFCSMAFAPLKRRLPDVHMILVLGPRLAAGSFEVNPEIEVSGYIPKLYELFACCDVAVVQCGASSTTELAALRRPFIYFPIERHFEQELVAERLARYSLGKRMSLKTATPESLAEAIFQACHLSVSDNLMPVHGAERAAQHILSKLDTVR